MGGVGIWVNRSRRDESAVERSGVGADEATVAEPVGAMRCNASIRSTRLVTVCPAIGPGAEGRADGVSAANGINSVEPTGPAATAPLGGRAAVASGRVVMASGVEAGAGGHASDGSSNSAGRVIRLGPGLDSEGEGLGVVGSPVRRPRASVKSAVNSTRIPASTSKTWTSGIRRTLGAVRHSMPSTPAASRTAASRARPPARIARFAVGPLMNGLRPLPVADILRIRCVWSGKGGRMRVHDEIHVPDPRAR